MPFKSKKQQRLFFSTMPEIAKEWASKTDFSKLPEKADKNNCGEVLDKAIEFEKHVKSHFQWTGLGCDICGFGTIENIEEFDPKKPCPECGIIND